MTVRKDKANVKEDLRLKAFHVGGRGGGFGPADKLLKIGKDLDFVTFEASTDDGDAAWDEYLSAIDYYKNKYGVNLSIVPACLLDRIEKRNFNVNVMPDSSSLLEISPSATNHQRQHDFNGIKCRLVWNEVCQPQSTFEVETTTLDKLYEEDKIPLADFLSIDTQGVEYDILKGASHLLQGDMLGVVLEGEFAPLYKDQKLFVDQHALLSSYQFRLIDFFNTEYWYAGPIIGKGALTMVESLFLRDYSYFISKKMAPSKLVAVLAKLAIIAFYFNRQSYAFEIMDCIMNDYKGEWQNIVKDTTVTYIRLLNDFYNYQVKQTDLPDYLDLLKTSEINTEKTERSKLDYYRWVIYNINLKMIVTKIRSMMMSNERKRFGLID